MFRAGVARFGLSRQGSRHTRASGRRNSWHRSCRRLHESPSSCRRAQRAGGAPALGQDHRCGRVRRHHPYLRPRWSNVSRRADGPRMGTVTLKPTNGRGHDHAPTGRPGRRHDERRRGSDHAVRPRRPRAKLSLKHVDLLRSRTTRCNRTDLLDGVPDCDEPGRGRPFTVTCRVPIVLTVDREC